jgi:rubredoxin
MATSTTTRDEQQPTSYDAHWQCDCGYFFEATVTPPSNEVVGAGTCPACGDEAPLIHAYPNDQ